MNTKDRLLAVAREQIQRKGYNGFSYADLAEEVGIRKASIHHHFATKADLGREVASQYHLEFMAALEAIENKKKSHRDKLKAYIQLFRKTLEQDHKVCLCIMLAANHETLPDAVRIEVTKFFKDNEIWLEKLLRAGEHGGEFELHSSAKEVAKSILSTLEGAMVIAESMGDGSRLKDVSQWIIRSVEKKQINPI